MERWLELLVDPVERKPLSIDGARLVAQNGAHYPFVDGIPVLLRSDTAPTHWGLKRSFKLSAHALRGLPIDPIDALHLGDAAKAQIRQRVAAGEDVAEAVIQRFLLLTNGLGYRTSLPRGAVPIPQFPLRGAGDRLLDVGCSWGRWTMAAARAGFSAIGVDPLLGPLLAGKRFAARNGFTVHFVCGDARALPFANATFDRVFSYSVLQHFSEDDCAIALRETGRVLAPIGESMIQMAHRTGVRSLWHQARRGFRAATSHEVRYRSLEHLLKMCESAIGPTSASVDCFFGLGLQPSDTAYMRPLAQLATTLSETLKPFAENVPALRSCADSLFLHSQRAATGR